VNFAAYFSGQPSREVFYRFPFRSLVLLYFRQNVTYAVSFVLINASRSQPDEQRLVDLRCQQRFTPRVELA
jgi:hypothetical protein